MQQLSSLAKDQQLSSTLKVWLSEQELFLQKLKSGDGEAFRTLYHQYAPALFGVISRSVLEEDAASDILEKTFSAIWKNISEYDETKLRLFTWINQIANRQIKDWQLGA